ncbi:transposase family protein [Streptomyces sp. NBC_00258]|nr:transposase family protein [Streptomyces sp. NBC_00258]
MEDFQVLEERGGGPTRASAPHAPQSRAHGRPRRRRQSQAHPADRVLATVLHLRKLATMDLLGQLFGVTAMTINRAKQEVRPLLETHGHHVDTSTARFHTPADVATFLASNPTPTKVKKTS